VRQEAGSPAKRSPGAVVQEPGDVAYPRENPRRSRASRSYTDHVEKELLSGLSRLVYQAERLFGGWDEACFLWTLVY